MQNFKRSVKYKCGYIEPHSFGTFVIDENIDYNLSEFKKIVCDRLELNDIADISQFAIILDEFTFKCTFTDNGGIGFRQMDFAFYNKIKYDTLTKYFDIILSNPSSLKIYFINSEGSNFKQSDGVVFEKKFYSERMIKDPITYKHRELMVKWRKKIIDTLL
jgi:hypothetical protein